MQIFSYLSDKALILKHSLAVSNTNTYIWSKERVWVLSVSEALSEYIFSFVAKTFFHQSR